jgi:adenine-specific DNA-methyltransferase
MPFLQWVNDNEARRAAKAVPFRLLKEEAVYGDASQAKDNLLVKGDNLDALRALIPFYRGKVKCIYIDPPYNTGSAFEHYDDNLEHSQWLSMMMPRLQLLREFLSEEGSIWVSIDDEEEPYLKVLMNEIYGRNNYVATNIWQKRYSRENREAIGDAHEYLLVYAKNKDVFKTIRNLVPMSEEQAKVYKNPNSDPRGRWRGVPMTAQGYRPNQMYPITDPKGGIHFPPEGRCWSTIESEFKNLLAEGRIYFGKNNNSQPSIIRYLSEVPGVTPWTWWPHDEVGHTDESKKESLALFGKQMFATPKPERLIQRVIHIATNPGDLILDSFLGSGTTAAVAHKMGRRYIGIEMGEHAKTHCIPRLQKVIDGEQGGISQAVNWQGGGGFTFYTLDEPVFDELGLINPKVDFKTLAAYLWQRETKEPSVPEYSPYLGSHQGTAYYLLFNGVLSEDNLVEPNVLTYSVLKSLLEDYPFNGPKVIYADACAGISDHELKKLQVTFKQIPYDIMQ